MKFYKCTTCGFESGFVPTEMFAKHHMKVTGHKRVLSFPIFVKADALAMNPSVSTTATGTGVH